MYSINAAIAARWDDLSSRGQERALRSGRAVRVAIARLGIESRIVWMDGPAYEAWLGNRRDSETLRAQWGAEQIAP